jgi:hypothetical protein
MTFVRLDTGYRLKLAQGRRRDRSARRRDHLSGA